MLNGDIDVEKPPQDIDLVKFVFTMQDVKFVFMDNINIVSMNCRKVEINVKKFFSI